MKPLVSKQYRGAHLLNPQWRYTNSASTDVRATFARVRAEEQRALLQREHGPAVRRIR